MKRIVHLEFKRTTDSSESYYQDMWKVAKQQHIPILTILRVLTTYQEWEVEVNPLVVGQRSVKEMEWLKSLKVFGIDKENGKKIIYGLGHTVKQT